MAAFRIARAAASVPAASFSLTAVLKACVIWWALACTRGRTSPPRSAANPRASVCASLAVSTPLPPGAIVSRGRGGGEEEEDEGEDERGGRESVCVLEREREYVCVCNRERERERECVCVCGVDERESKRKTREKDERPLGNCLLLRLVRLLASSTPISRSLSRYRIPRFSTISQQHIKDRGGESIEEGRKRDQTTPRAFTCPFSSFFPILLSISLPFPLFLYLYLYLCLSLCLSLL